jgi:hypothetical protein
MNLIENIQMLAQLKSSVEVMRDLVKDEKNKGVLLYEYTHTLRSIEEAYEHKKNIFTQKNILHPEDFRHNRYLLDDDVRKMKIRSSLLMLTNECGINKKEIQDIINEDKDL